MFTSFQIITMSQFYTVTTINGKGYSKVMDQDCYENVLGVDIKLHAFITLPLDGGKLSASHAIHFNPWKIFPISYWI
jgi:hypothetical protein